MLSLGTVAFLHPWLLAALIGLPALWWLLRITPPMPRLIRFPAVRLLLGLAQSEETPAHTPPWLVALRLLLAALIIVGLAQPLLNPAGSRAGDGPLILVVDNGWAAARNWSARQRTLTSLIEGALREGRPAMLLATAPPPSGDKLQASGLLPAAEIQRLVQALQPQPWPTDRAAARAALQNVKLNEPASVVWLSDGLAQGEAANLASRLQQFGPVELVSDSDTALPHLLIPPSIQGAELGLTIARATTEGDERLIVRALDEHGHQAAETQLTIDAGKRLALGKFAIPVELRNQIARLEIVGERTVGATVLLDERWRRRPVGVVTPPATEQAEPLLGGHYYLDRALQPYSEVVNGALEQLLHRELAVLVLTDIDPLALPVRQQLERWIERGGTLVRFAGPRLAQGDDDLVPVKLRQGERELGGAMSWAKPEALAPFDPRSPFAGLDIPPDVEIKRQVLAEPSLDLDQKTWARLTDGTPLVTADKRGSGWLVLIHTTANPDWSSLPFSGLFVEMLQRIVALSQGVSGAAEKVNLPPLKTLDAFGDLVNPPPAANTLNADDLGHPQLGPRHPPGYYGNQASRRALNLTNALVEINPLRNLPSGLIRTFYGTQREQDLKPWLLGGAVLLALADLIISLALRGLLVGRRVRQISAGVAAVLFATMLAATPEARAADAQSTIDDASAIAAITTTRLAYVATGNNAVDDISKAGLTGLTLALNARTAVEAAAPMAVDPAKDELVFFPLIYWPVTDGTPSPSARAIEKVTDYLRNGGLILFDTRDPNRGAPSWRTLRRLLNDLDLPAIVPVPDEHVLTRSFYLIHDFPGRLDGSTVWVERAEGNVNDGVSSVVIGGNDWAGAWAVDDAARPLMAVTPGGEHQREMALRFGINLAMYALTGNYKSDQVHLPAILERLGL